jgi:hypothetical protein
VLTSNFTRGAVTGLGLVNLGAGFIDLARVFRARGRSEISMPDGTPPA